MKSPDSAIGWGAKGKINGIKAYSRMPILRRSQ